MQALMHRLRKLAQQQNRRDKLNSLKRACWFRSHSKFFLKQHLLVRSQSLIGISEAEIERSSQVMSRLLLFTARNAACLTDKPVQHVGAAVIG